MPPILTDLVLFSLVTAFYTGIVIALASLLTGAPRPAWMGRGLPSWVPSPEPRFDATSKRGSVCARYRNVRPVGELPLRT
jgi:hypothetical protein